MTRESGVPAASFDEAAELLSSAVFVLDRSARIVWCSGSAEALAGASLRILQGLSVSTLLPEIGESLSHALENPGRSLPLQAQGAMALPGAGPVRVQVTLSRSPAADRFLLEVCDVERVLRHAREEQEEGMSEASRVLLRNLAHEVKNPLGGIRGAAQLLEGELSSPAQREYTEVIIAEADRLQSLVDRLLAPWRRARTLQEVNIHEVLERVANLVCAEFPEGLTVDRDYDVSVPSVTADRGQLVQMFLNLLRNAAQACRERREAGDARIRLVTRVERRVTVQRKLLRMALSVHVIDNGPGIAPEIREKIFYPLVTGREDGTGLGLSMVQTCMTQHGGSVDVESVPGRTDFRLLFPLGEPAQAAERS